MKKRIAPFFLSLVAVLFAACGWNTRHSVEKKEGEISILRYDKLLGEYVRSNSFSALRKLMMDYPQPTKILIEDILNIGRVEDDTILQRLQHFYSDTTLVRLTNDVEAKFPNLDEVEKDLEKGFQKLKKEVPDTKIPFIYAQISAFNESIIVVDTLLGISLDKYMGEDYPLYKRFYYDYQCRSMNTDRIVPDCFVFYLLSRYEMNYSESLCLQKLMIHYGKIHYVVQQLLDYKDGGQTMGYSAEENHWCKTHEKELWEYICQSEHLRARDPMIIRQYMRSARSVEMLGEQAPPFLGIWLGMRIVSSYMKRHKDMTIKELLEFTDYYTLLQESGYERK